MDKNALPFFPAFQDMESNRADVVLTVQKKQKKQQLANNLELFKIKGDGYLSRCQGEFYVFFHTWQKCKDVDSGDQKCNVGALSEKNIHRVRQYSIFFQNDARLALVFRIGINTITEEEEFRINAHILSTFPFLLNASNTV